MQILIYIMLTGVFSYHSYESSLKFRGASAFIKLMLDLAGNVGHLVYYGLLIWSFWKFEWWQPIAVYGIGSLIGGLTALLFQNTIIGNVFNWQLTILFAILSIINLSQM